MATEDRLVKALAKLQFAVDVVSEGSYKSSTAEEASDKMRNAHTNRSAARYEMRTVFIELLQDIVDSGEASLVQQD